MKRTELNSVRNERFLYLAVWTVIAVLPVILELWKLINDSEFKWLFVFRWWIGMIPLILIFLIHNHFLLPKFMKKGRIRQYCMILLLILSVYGGVQYLIDRPVHRELKERPLPPKPPFEFGDGSPTRPPMPDGANIPDRPARPKNMPPRPFPFPLLFKIMLAAMTLGMNVAISLAFTYNREQANRREQENKRLQEELKYLKQQISPHFLMNVLNNIHEMAEEDIREAQNMIMELSHLMRYVLYESENEMTTLSAGGSPVLSVQKLIPFQSDAQFSDEDINNLTITITDRTSGKEYLLSGTGEGTYGNADLIAEEAHEYELYFDYDGVPVTAVTTVPSAPEEVSFSATRIEVMNFQPPQAMSKVPADGIEISWKNDEGEYYIVEGKTGSTNPVMDIEDDDDMPAKSFKLNYTQGTSATLSSSDFNYYGTYHISVIHINQEYAVMSQGGSTSSTTLVDVKGNIDGGYGIFTGISSVTRTISVAKGSSPF